MRLLILNGSVLKTQFEWLTENADADARGILRCKHTGIEIHSRVEHRYRFVADGKEAPYVAEKLFLGSGGGQQISFNAFFCRGCDIPEIPDTVSRREVIMIKEGAVS